MKICISSDGFALVSPDFVMNDALLKPPPTKRMLLCGNINTGKTVLSTWGDLYGFTHWAPLPVFPKETMKVKE